MGKKLQDQLENALTAGLLVILSISISSVILLVSLYIDARRKEHKRAERNRNCIYRLYHEGEYLDTRAFRCAPMFLDLRDAGYKYRRMYKCELYQSAEECLKDYWNQPYR